MERDAALIEMKYTYENNVIIKNLTAGISKMLM